MFLYRPIQNKRVTKFLFYAFFLPHNIHNIQEMHDIAYLMLYQTARAVVSLRATRRGSEKEKLEAAAWIRPAQRIK